MTTTAPRYLPVEAVPELDAYHHVSLTVTDVEASERWYRAVFGLERAFVEEHGDAGYTVVLQRPGTPVFLGLVHHEVNGHEGFAEHRTGLDHFAFRVGSREELDRWLGHFTALDVPNSGIAQAAEPFPYALIVARDPDNIQLEVIWS